MRNGGCVMKGIWSQEISEPTLAQVARDMFHRGYGVIADFFSEDDLEPIRKLALHAGEVAGGEYTGFTGPDAFRGTTLGELPDHEPFRDLCRRLYELGTGQQAPEIGFYQIFRCLQGRGGLKNSYIFHYDSYVLTVLLPIAMPNSGLKGDLLMFPNLRPIRSTYVRNLWDKFLVDNPISQLFLRRLAKKVTRGPLAVQMQPGSAYFFWGYRSLHANEPCDPDKLRATALLHYGDPHRDNKMRSCLRAIRRK
jgi:hypothetical protein